MRACGLYVNGNINIPEDSLRPRAHACEELRCTWREACKALLAIEDPEKGILFDDFDLRYREQEAKRDLKSAAWFYRDKTPFDTKYGEDCGTGGGEPAWVSDRGRGAAHRRSPLCTPRMAPDSRLGCRLG